MNSLSNTCVSTNTIDTVSIVQLGRRRTLMASIEQGTFLLQTPPASILRIRDAPIIESGSLKKMYNRSTLLAELKGSTHLNVVDASSINDRSAPVIDALVHIRFSERRAFLNSLLLQTEQFFSRLRKETPAKVQNLFEASMETADWTQHKAVDIIDSSKVVLNSLVQTGAETAGKAKVGAQDLIETSRVNAQGLLESSQEVANKAKLNAQDLLETGLEKTAQARVQAKDLFGAGVNKMGQALDSGKDLTIGTVQLASATGSAIAVKASEISNKVQSFINEKAELAFTDRTSLPASM